MKSTHLIDQPIAVRVQFTLRQMHQRTPQEVLDVVDRLQVTQTGLWFRIQSRRSPPWPLTCESASIADAAVSAGC